MTKKNEHNHETILRGTLLEGRSQSEIARELGITRARVGQILWESYQIRFEPVLVIGKPEKVQQVLPQWVSGVTGQALGGNDEQLHNVPAE